MAVTPIGRTQVRVARSRRQVPGHCLADQVTVQFQDPQVPWRWEFRFQV